MSLTDMIEKMAKDARQAARQLRRIGSSEKDAALELTAAKLIDRQTDIMNENEKDLAQARQKGLSAAMIDRLTLDEKVIRGMAAEGLREMIALPDPVGEVTGRSSV